MIAPEDLFLAIGSADDELLLRSERPRPRSALRWWPGAAAACLLVGLTALFFRGAPQTALCPAPPDPPVSVQTLRLSGAGVGTLHLLDTQWQAPPETPAAPGFLLYINPEQYAGGEQDGVYVIRPVTPAQGLPVPCTLTITHRGGLSPQEAALAAAEDLRTSLAQVSEAVAVTHPAGLRLHGDNGSAWDAEQVDLNIVDDGRGGVFLLTARYFTEAAEGHGARFSDMIQTFEVLPADPAGVPVWLTDLKAAVRALVPAIFSNDLSGVEAALADGAAIDAYGADVLSDVSVASIDYTVDDDRSPASAVVSVKHRLGPEDAYAYLTLELRLEDGVWLAAWGGLER